MPQLDARVDRGKAKALGVPLSDVFSTLQIFLGSLYVNDFNAFGRVYRVQLQAEPSFRATPADVGRLPVRGQPGANGRLPQMVPLSTLVTVKPVSGPDTISHYNLYRSAEIAGDTAPGASSGQAIAAMEDLARRVLPPGMAYEWTGLAFQEIEAGSRAGVVFAFRPILMTSFAFVLGSLPLMFASGAGAASRHSIGTTVVGGMLAITVLGVLLIPAFYVAVERLEEWRPRSRAGRAGANGHGEPAARRGKRERRGRSRR